MTDYLDSVNALIDEFPEVAAALSKCTNLDRAIQYVLSSDFFLPSQMDVIAQDEFTHDVFIPFAKGEKCLVLFAT